MVKLRVHVRVIPEDVYLDNLDTGKPISKRNERAFKLIIREPTDWYVGALANEARARYQSNYKHDLGRVKYLKDSEDADLDPEYLVSDVLVDEGQAAADGRDQQVSIKIVTEQGRGVRVGSVIPDLTPVHFQPPPQNLPPVPKFGDVPSSLGKRTHDAFAAPFTNGAVSKRQRMDQIEEADEHDQVIASIESDAVKNDQNIIIQDSQIPTSAQLHSHPERQSRESPELGATATANEYMDSASESSRSPELSKKMPVPTTRRFEEIMNETTNVRHRLSRSPGSSQQHPLTKSVLDPHIATPDQTPITPVSEVRRGANAASTASLLNGMKSASPAARQSLSTSASKFRRGNRDVYDHPDSYIDDSQMSPKKITPRLVRTTAKAGKTTAQASNKTQDAFSEDIVQVAEQQRDTDPMEGLERPLVGEILPNATTGSAVQQHRKMAMNTTLTTPPAPSSDFGSNGSSLGGDRKSKKLKRRTRKKAPVEGAGTNVEKETNEPEIPDSEAQEQTSATKTTLNKNALALRRDAGSPDNLDSPGAQLSHSLAQSTPSQEKTYDINTSQRISTSVTPVPQAKASNQKQNKQKSTPNAKEISSQLSNSSLEETETTSAGKDTAKQTKKSRTPTNQLRCLACWISVRTCDNARPQCSACKNKRQNCQEFDLTRAQADRIREERRGQRASKTPIRKTSNDTIARPSASTTMTTPSTVQKIAPEPAVSSKKSSKQSGKKADMSAVRDLADTNTADRSSAAVVSDTLPQELPHWGSEPAQSVPVPKIAITPEESPTKPGTILPPGMSKAAWRAAVLASKDMTEEERQARKKAVQSFTLTKSTSRESEPPKPAVQQNNARKITPQLVQAAAVAPPTVSANTTSTKSSGSEEEETTSEDSEEDADSPPIKPIDLKKASAPTSAVSSQHDETSSKSTSASSTASSTSESEGQSPPPPRAKPAPKAKAKQSNNQPYKPPPTTTKPTPASATTKKADTSVANGGTLSSAKTLAELRRKMDTSRTNSPRPGVSLAGSRTTSATSLLAAAKSRNAAVGVGKQGFSGGQKATFNVDDDDDDEDSEDDESD